LPRGAWGMGGGAAAEGLKRQTANFNVAQSETCCFARFLKEMEGYV